nr:chromosome partitioning protein [Streptomyces sp. S1D4-11]
MVGVEIAVGYVFAWLTRKAKASTDRADAEVERVLDAGMDRVHELVSRKLGQDPALERAAEEAERGLEEPSERTRRRLTDSIEDEAERDPGFAGRLEELVAQLQSAAQAGGVTTLSVNVFYGSAAVQNGDHNRQHSGFGD